MSVVAPDQILAKRLYLEREMIKKKKPMSVEMLAVFFNTAPPVIRRDLGYIGLLDQLLKEKDHDRAWLDREAQKRDAEILKRVNAGEDPQTVWAEYGLWRAPRERKDLGIKIDTIKKLDADKGAALSEALCLCMMGFTPAEALKYLGGKSIHEEQLLITYLKGKRGVKPGHTLLNTDSDMKAYARSVIPSPDTTGRSTLVIEIARVTGANQEEVRKAVGLNGREYRNSYSVFQEDKKRRREKIYDLYVNAKLCQDDIAVIMGVSRATVVNCIRDQRTEHPEEHIEKRAEFKPKLSAEDKKELRDLHDTIKRIDEDIRKYENEMGLLLKTKKRENDKKHKKPVPNKKEYMHLRNEKNKLRREKEAIEAKILAIIKPYIDKDQTSGSQ